jgi:hypothetical protein
MERFHAARRTIGLHKQGGTNRAGEYENYRHAKLETDLSVHLCWKSDQPKQNRSHLGLHLARALKKFGLIDHSMWIEIKKELSPQQIPKTLCPSLFRCE